MALQVPRPRIESLSDLIFGLALSIGALALFANPTSMQAADPTLVVLTDLSAFFYTFVMLILVWVRYTALVPFLPIESPRTLRLNITMLFLVAIEPYLFNQIFGVNHPPWTSPLGLFVTSLFALDFGGLLAILAAFDHLALRQTSVRVPDDRKRQFSFQRISQAVGGAFFLLSAVPWFGTTSIDGTSLRLYLWLVPLFLIGLVRRGTAIGTWIGKRRGSSPETMPAGEESPRPR